MEEYLSERAKFKAIATYAFYSVNSADSNTISVKKVKDAMHKSLLQLNPDASLEKFD